jgi:hypothetical protein
MFLIQEGNWKKQFTEATQLNTDLKKVSIVVFTILYRMPMTILEHAADVKSSGERWKAMHFETDIETQDMFHEMTKTAEINKETAWMLSYLEVVQKLQSRQSRQSTQHSKQAVQRFVALFENGINDGDLRSALEYFQIVQSKYIKETKTFAIDLHPTHSYTHPGQQNLERTNRELLRQIQKLQGLSTTAEPVKAAVARADPGHEAFNKLCAECKEYFLVDAPWKAKHSMCLACHHKTPAGVAKLAEASARKGQARKRSHDQSRNAKVQAVRVNGDTAGQAEDTAGQAARQQTEFTTEAEMLRLKKAQAEVARAASQHNVSGMMMNVVSEKSQPAVEVIGQTTQSAQQETATVAAATDDAATTADAAQSGGYRIQAVDVDPEDESDDDNDEGAGASRVQSIQIGGTTYFPPFSGSTHFLATTDSAGPSVGPCDKRRNITLEVLAALEGKSESQHDGLGQQNLGVHSGHMQSVAGHSTVLPAGDQHRVHKHHRVWYSAFVLLRCRSASTCCRPCFTVFMPCQPVVKLLST